MSYSKSLFLFLFIGVLFFSCKDTQSPPNSNLISKSETVLEKQVIAPENLATSSFKIDGMTCSFGCAKTIEKQLNETNGVELATVDFDKKLATVSFDVTVQNPTSLKNIVEATADGKTYKVSNIKSSGDHAMSSNDGQEMKPENK